MDVSTLLKIVPYLTIGAGGVVIFLGACLTIKHYIHMLKQRLAMILVVIGIAIMIIGFNYLPP